MDPDIDLDPYLSDVYREPAGGWPVDRVPVAGHSSEVFGCGTLREMVRAKHVHTPAVWIKGKGWVCACGAVARGRKEK